MSPGRARRAWVQRPHSGVTWLRSTARSTPPRFTPTSSGAPASFPETGAILPNHSAGRHGELARDDAGPDERWSPGERLSGGLDRSTLVVAGVATLGLIMAVLDT